ncbi:hypothetical protein SYNPS1DRAFT_26691 [Syncephalis pseudoplumigaleata]|uniref:DASH complex subunit DAD2 n=1 Tax=Syncephalis pseudoplumigaleata TaxID=1712513 RepID=A0A4P9Z4Z8_9FUNG|nr:hypothetical protein SYNPS1DRAFT_26691 [Syncephalis pseudoplumigaleata]|eukprot:RKP27663.1 hypothetical protein SYNPS1DRAFT_26691 [Syncephalis pseudoplumigaleata]
MTLPESQAGGSALAMSLHAQLEEKQRELQGLLAIRDLSRGLHNYLEVLCERIDELNDGYEGTAYAPAISHVMCNWQNVFRDMNLVEAQKEAQRPPQTPSEDDKHDDDGDGDATETRNRMVLGTQLVLLPLHGQDATDATPSAI